MKINWGVSLLNIKEFNASRAFNETLLCDPNLDRHDKNIILNNIACADLYIGREDLLVEADQYSYQAFTAEPENEYFTGTRGSVLIELGRINEGMDLLKKGYELATSSPYRQAWLLCYMASGEKRRGNQELGMQYLAEARIKCPGCFLLEQTEKKFLSISESEVP